MERKKEITWRSIKYREKKSELLRSCSPFA